LAFGFWLLAFGFNASRFLVLSINYLDIMLAIALVIRYTKYSIFPIPLFTSYLILCTSNFYSPTAHMQHQYPFL